MSNLIRIIFAVLFLVSCSEPDETVLEAEWPNLTARATLNPSISNFSENRLKVSAHLTIQNLTAEPQQYSNGWLWLRTKGGPSSRTYLDNLTSHYVDVGAVDLPRNGTLEVPVYWVFPESSRGELDFKSLTLELKRVD